MTATPAGTGVPTLSEWGMIILTLLLIGAGCLMIGRRGPAQANLAA